MSAVVATNPGDCSRLAKIRWEKLPPDVEPTAVVGENVADDGFDLSSKVGDIGPRIEVKVKGIGIAFGLLLDFSQAALFLSRLIKSSNLFRKGSEKDGNSEKISINHGGPRAVASTDISASPFVAEQERTTDADQKTAKLSTKNVNEHG